VVSLNDVDAFTRAVLDLYASPERRAGIRSHNLAAVETYFIDRCARRYENIFEEAIAAHADALEPARQK
jgi:glycosyltransferase involved in cell wall biosynthesis